MAKDKPKYFGLSLRNLRYRLRRFKDMLGTDLQEIIMEHEAIILDMIRFEQLYYNGQNGNNESIWTYAPYAPLTIRLKRKKGQPTDRVTLFDTGDFYASMFIEADDKGFIVKAEDPKAPGLLDKYKPTILKLSNMSLKKLLWDYVRPEMAERIIRSYTG